MIGGESLQSDLDADYEKLMVKHLLMLERDPRTRNALKVVTIESNLNKANPGRWATTIQKQPELQRNVWCFDLHREQTGRNPGFHTTLQSKLQGVDITRHHLHMASLHMARGLITQHKGGADAIVAKLFDQMKRVTYHEKLAENEFGTDRFDVNAKGGGNHDDLWMCLTIGVVAAVSTRTSESFLGRLRQRGLNTQYSLYDQKLFAAIAGGAGDGD